MTRQTPLTRTAGPLAEQRVRLADDLVALLEALGFEPWRGSDRRSLVVACQVGAQDARLGLRLEAELAHFHLVLPLQVAQGAAGAVAATVCHINRSLPLPGFCFDSESGEISFRISLPLDVSGLAARVVEALLVTCVSTAERHLAELTGVAGSEPSGPRPSRRQARYAEVVTYRARRGGAQVSETQALPVAPRGALLDDSLLGSGGALVWDQATGQAVGRADGSELSALVQGAWERADEDSLRQRWGSSRRRLVATCAWPGAAAGIAEVLARLGFDEPYDEVVVERSLMAALPVLDGALSLSAVAQPPVELLALAMHGSGNRALAGLDAAGLLRSLSDGSSTAAGGAAWHLAQSGSEPAGLFCVGRAEGRDRAGLDFIGLLPRWRGRQLGRVLHAAALHELARRGVRSYRDSSDVLNRPMQRIFFWNGCRMVATLRNFRLTP